MRAQIFFLITIGLLFSSCKKKSFIVDEYPVQSGKEWNYDIKYRTFNFRPIQPGATYHLDTLNWTGKVEAKGKVTLPNSTRADKFESIESDPRTSQMYASTYFYINRSDTMFRVAYSYNGSSQFLPKSLPGIKFTFKNKKFSSVIEILKFVENGFVESSFSSDSIIISDKPVIPFVFPLKIGKEWTYVINEGFPLIKIVKKVIAKTSLTVGSQIYSSYKIQWLFFNSNNQIDTNIIYYDYMGDNGLLKREMIFKNIPVSTPESPDGIGYVDFKSEYNLISFK